MTVTGRLGGTLAGFGTIGSLARRQPVVALGAAYLAACAVDLAWGWNASLAVLAWAFLWALGANADVRLPWWDRMRCLRHRIERRRGADGWTCVTKVKVAGTDGVWFKAYVRFEARPPRGATSTRLAVALGRGDKRWRRGDLAMTIDADGRGVMDLSGLLTRAPNLKLRVDVGWGPDNKPATYAVEVEPRDEPEAAFEPDASMAEDTAAMASVRATLSNARLGERWRIGVTRRRIAKAVHPDLAADEFERAERERAMGAANAYLTRLEEALSE